MLGERLKRLRQEKKITQQQLAEIIEVTHVSISGYERGNRSPDTATLQKLADFFDVSTDYLLGRTNIPNPYSQEKKSADEEAFQKFLNDPNLQVFYKELPNSEEEEIEMLREFWEFIKHKNK